MTSCYAYERFGKDCEHDVGGTGDDNKCWLSFELGDATCRTVGASTFLCTYSCWDGEAGQDSWCRDGAVCGATTVIYCENP